MISQRLLNPRAILWFNSSFINLLNSKVAGGSWDYLNIYCEKFEYTKNFEQF